MPSNVILNAGAGGPFALTKQITHDGDTTHCQGVHLLGISGTEDAYTAGTINGDAANGLDVDVTRILPGSTALALGKLEDTAHASGDLGVFSLAIRQDTLVSLVAVDGSYAGFKVNAVGRLYVSATIDAALPAGTNNIGDVDVLSLPALVAGTANIGDVDVLTVPADPFGLNADVSSAMGSISAKLRFLAAGIAGATSLPAGINNIGDVDVLTMPSDGGATSGGLSPYSAISAAVVLSAIIKTSAGQVYSVQVFNLNAAARFVRLYNQTTAPASTDGANILWRGIVPGNTAGAGFVVPFDKGLTFGTGIGIRASAAIADNDATALAANELVFNVQYK